MVNRVLTQPQELDAWDAWIINHPHANHVHLSWWMRGQRFPLLRSTVMACYEAGRIVGGAALYHFEMPVIGHGVTIAANGPLVEPGRLDVLPHLVHDLARHARERNAVLLQFEGFAPELSSELARVTSHWRTEPDVVWNLYHPGRWHDVRILVRDRTEEQLLMQFSSKTRYRIRQAIRRGYEVTECLDVGDLKTGHDMWAEAGRRNGFAVRPWGTFLDLYRAGHARGHAVAALCRLDREPLAFKLNVWAGRGLHGIGLAIRRVPAAAPAGRILYWRCLEWVRRRGFDYYSLGGFGAGVANDQFKRSFAPEVVDNHRAISILLRPGLVSLARSWISGDRNIELRKSLMRLVFARRTSAGQSPVETDTDEESGESV